MNGLKKTFAIAAAVSMVGLSSVGAMAANEKLIVKDSGGTNNIFIVRSDGTGLTAPDSGFVGVGTASPGSALHVSGATKGNASQVKVFSTDATGANIGGGGFFLGHNNGPAGTPNNLPKLNDRVGYLNVGTIDDLQPGVNLFAGGFVFSAAANWTIDRPSNASHFPTYLQLRTAGTSGSAQNRLVIYPNGGVYVGANFTLATPPTVTQKLEVDGGTRLIPQTVAPTCTVGTIYFDSVADAIMVCTGAGLKTVTAN